MGVIFAVLSIGLAWTLPNVADRNAIESITRPFDRTWKRVEDTWSRMYRSLRYPGTVGESTAFGKSLVLGGPVSLTDWPIFRAETPEQVYWRSSAFDTYTGDSWQNTDSHVLNWRDNHTLPESVFDMRREITVTIRTLEARQDVIFGPPQPVRVSLPLDADVFLLPGPDTQVIASLLRSRLPVYRNYTYKVASAVSAAPPELLRADGASYPAWITGRYLQIPDIVPVRVRREAYRITAPYTNPYDKAVALETFLRKYEYNKEIAAPRPAVTRWTTSYTTSAKATAITMPARW